MPAPDWVTHRGFILVVVACLLAGAAATVAGAEDWPQIMGASRNGVATDSQAPKIPSSKDPLFSRPVGHGFAGPVVAGETLVLFHREGNQEIVEAIHHTTGVTRWRSAYSSTYRDDFGFDNGPRAPATIHGDRVITHGAQGRLTALDLSNGRIVWQVDTHKQFDVTKGFFGAASSPLVVEGADGVLRVLLNLGGAEAGVVAFLLADGSVSWKATRDGASYSSPVPYSRDGKSGAAFFTRNGLVTLDATTGEVWATAAWRSRLRSSVNATLPIVLEDQRVLLSSSYGTGAVVFDLSTESPEQVWTSKESLAAHYAPVLARDGVLYGFHGRVEYGGALRAVEAATGKVLWSEETGAGSVFSVAGVLVALLDSGELRLVKADRNSYQELGRMQLFDSTTRALPAYQDGVLYARDEKRLAAWRLR